MHECFIPENDLNGLKNEWKPLSTLSINLGPSFITFNHNFPSCGPGPPLSIWFQKPPSQVYPEAHTFLFTGFFLQLFPGKSLRAFHRWNVGGTNMVILFHSLWFLICTWCVKFFFLACFSSDQCCLVLMISGWVSNSRMPLCTIVFVVSLLVLFSIKNIIFIPSFLLKKYSRLRQISDTAVTDSPFRDGSQDIEFESSFS